MTRQKTIWGVLIFVFLVVLGYFLFRNTGVVDYSASSSAQAVTQTATSSAPVASAASSTSAIDTSNWKTYSNYELGFSIMYPSNLVLDTSDPSQLKASFPSDGSTVSIAVATACGPIDASGPNDISNKDSTINGIDFTENLVSTDNSQTTTYDTENNSACYRISFSNTGSNDADAFNAMLPTFAFINTPAGENESDYAPTLQNLNASATTTPASNTQVVLNSVNPTIVSVGDTVTLKGSGFSGHDTLVWISDGNTKGVLWGGMPSSDATLLVTIPSQACTQYVGASGAQCPSYLVVRPGIYTVSVSNQNGTTDELYITVN